jgi:hypothetical protein
VCRKPPTLQHGFNLNEWYGGICAAERETPGY